MHVLVTGGAGYIGSYVVPALLACGHRVTVVDDLSNGHLNAVSSPAVQFITDDAGDPGVEADVIIHLASRIVVSDSARSHWANNVGVTTRLLECTHPKKIIFASSAAVYGNAAMSPIREETELRPVSAYGQTKVVIEQMLDAFGAEWSALRLFNVAGGRERHKEETHLLPLALRGEVTIHGSGEMVRDYIHVEDVADAFVRAIDGRPGIYNIGTGVGTSVRELLYCVERMTGGRQIEVTNGPPRAGDPRELVANIDRARDQLGWAPSRNLEEIVTSAAQLEAQ